MREVVYSGSRNLYEHMVPAVKSLLYHTDVDRVWLLIEDDEFPFSLPGCVRTVNVGNQTVFRRDGPNMRSQFTYLALMRAAYTKVLPESVETVLQLDVDTVVTDDLSPLWAVDLSDSYFAAVPEHLGTFKPYGDKYYNAGVMLINLERTRRDGLDDAMIAFLDRERAPYIDQDAWNKYAARYAVDLPVRYNETFVTGYTEDPAIVHYAGVKDWAANRTMERAEYLAAARQMSWREVLLAQEKLSTPTSPGRPCTVMTD